MKIANLQYAITSNVIYEITWQNGNRRQDHRLCLEKWEKHIKTILIYIRHSIQHVGLMHGHSKQQGTTGVLRVLVLYWRSKCNRKDVIRWFPLARITRTLPNRELTISFPRNLNAPYLQLRKKNSIPHTLTHTKPRQLHGWQLFTEVKVNGGGYLPSREAAR